MVQKTNGSPACPCCAGPTKHRPGKKPRTEFWVCTEHPACPGFLPAIPPYPGAERERRQRTPLTLPVEWIEGSAQPRAAFVPEYAAIGALPGILSNDTRNDPRIRWTLSQCLLLSRRNRPRNDATEGSRFTGALVLKVLRRGQAPLATLGIEREALHARGLTGRTMELGPDDREVGWRSRKPLRAAADAILAVASRRDRFVLDSAFDFKPGSGESTLASEAESAFLKTWTPRALGPTAAHWMTPQAPLDRLLEAGQADHGNGGRRCDFLFNHPGARPFVIEIDGPEHDTDADDARDRDLQSIGIDVIRVTNAEALRGTGPDLDRVRLRCAEALAAFRAVMDDDKDIAAAAVDCATAAKVQFAVARAVEYGWLTGNADWLVEITGAQSTAAAAVQDTLTLLSGFDGLYGTNSGPTSCTVRTDDGETRTWVYKNGDWRKDPHKGTPERRPDRVRIAIEQRSSPFHAIGNNEADFVIRPVFLPVPLASGTVFDRSRKRIAPEMYAEAKTSLEIFLRNVFRKRTFRPCQGEAVFNALRGTDCVALLPTGGGKSIIYQLAGLLMPGLTLVVDPINALIDDQVEGLQRYGIDRAAPITGGTEPAERRQQLIRMERGEYIFALHSPERLQSRQFRSMLRALAESSIVNLAVIDEAHCVSEWGHDFRPAYLNLGTNLRNHGSRKGEDPPPLLALTGTASRAVLRDMLADLGIDQRSDAVIRPHSFDRPELLFKIIRTSPEEDPAAALRGSLKTLPAKFGLPPSEFFRPAGERTASGIVFVQTVKNKVDGILATRDTVATATSADVTIYSGTSPWPSEPRRAESWNDEKRLNAEAFKSNRVPILVATKAFGMGIDKPNIRYTVHRGMPMSLESFYQEAGRAGRDGGAARSTAVFSEYDPARSDHLTDPYASLDELQKRFAETAADRETSDDVTLALWFHLKAFGGITQEISMVESVLNKIGDLSSKHKSVIPYQNEEEKSATEKAVYQLVKLDVIRDYEVDYGGKKLIVHTDAFNVERSKEALNKYVQARTPGKSANFTRRMDTLTADGSNRTAVLTLAKLLLDYTYDEIERSRRRAIMEAVQLARHAATDADIRRRLLNYLSEGVGAEPISRLVEQERVNFAAWWALTAKTQTEIEADELRGLTIRALESYPDHPGLLLTRSVAEAMCSDRDDNVIRRGIETAILAAMDKYEIPANEIASSVAQLFDLTGKQASDLGPLVTATLLNLADQRDDCRWLATPTEALARNLRNPRVNAILAMRQAESAIDRLDTAVRRVVDREDGTEP